MEQKKLMKNPFTIAGFFNMMKGESQKKPEIKKEETNKTNKKDNK